MFDCRQLTWEWCGSLEKGCLRGEFFLKRDYKIQKAPHQMMRGFLNLFVKYNLIQ